MNHGTRLIFIGAAVAAATSGCRREEVRPEELFQAQSLGLNDLELGRLQEAEAQFKKVMALAPGEPLGYANLGLTYLRCARYGTALFEQCLLWGLSAINTCAQWADEGYSACGQWADEGHNECCDWWPCSWACDAFYWVAHWVCVFFVWVANLVCILFVLIFFFVCLIVTIVITIVCLVWAWIEVWFCLSTANGGTAFLLTDGTVLVQECNVWQATRRWWRLHPDENGNYFNGLWSRAADSHVARLYFASAVLADGRLIVAGGEYSNASGLFTDDETNRCEIYDPVADTWTEIDPPASSVGTIWSEIGDGASTLLADGTFLLGNAIDKQTAIFDPKTTAWTAQGDKNRRSSEESWVLLTDGTVITANCYGHPKAEKFVPSSHAWMIEADVTVDIVEDASKEIGPAILLPDGRALYVGATGATALYTMPATPTAQGTWTAGANLPMAGSLQQGTKDGPGCLLVSGNVLIGIAPVNNVEGDTCRRPPSSSSTAPISAPPAIHRTTTTSRSRVGCCCSRLAT